MIDDQTPENEPDTPTPLTNSPPRSTNWRRPSSTGPVNGHLATTSSTLIVASQIRLVPSCEAEATRLPSGDHDTLLTGLAWVPTTMISASESASQIRIVWSCDAVASRRPSGHQATSRTQSSWPRSTVSSLPPSAGPGSAADDPIGSSGRGLPKVDVPNVADCARNEAPGTRPPITVVNKKSSAKSLPPRRNMYRIRPELGSSSDMDINQVSHDGSELASSRTGRRTCSVRPRPRESEADATKSGTCCSVEGVVGQDPGKVRRGRAG